MILLQLENFDVIFFRFTHTIRNMDKLNIYIYFKNIIPLNSFGVMYMYISEKAKIVCFVL